MAKDRYGLSDKDNCVIIFAIKSSYVCLDLKTT
jgi:hypothetical protein